MKVMVIGADGQLGTDLCLFLNTKDMIPLTHEEIEVADMKSVKNAFLKYNPQLVINTAAFIRVDDCEDRIDFAYEVNALGAKNVAVQCEDHGAGLIHISSDYVFGGEQANRSIPYTEFDLPAPLNIYGKSKLAGEQYVSNICRKHMIVRTSGLFGVNGAKSKNGNFIETMIRLGKEKTELKVVNDQVFSPTFTADLAQKIVEIIETEYYGVCHITNSGYCSWYEFATEILDLTGLKTAVSPVSSEKYMQKAVRPRYSVLDNHQIKLLGLSPMRHWREALEDYLGRKGHTLRGS